MINNTVEEANLRLAQQWCVARGEGWSVRDTAGRGGTAPVFSLDTPDGSRALKLYDAKFSQGELGDESETRLKPQLALGSHDCPYLVRVYEGGRFEDRLFVLMDKAQGQELEKRLQHIPREKIRRIVSQVAVAAIFLRAKGLCHRDIKSANIFISDDFDHVTLLDLSVLRDVYDPVGLGTDHGGELPVVATSRYSPPEYLFRLIPPDVQLWHALDVYQLGGLLHDLIMREPMFEQEYKRTRDTNRYRFAYIVAVQAPDIHAPDVDPDLVYLAHRALDKDWQRRSQLQLEDFLDDANARRALGLEVLGLNARSAISTPPRTPAHKRLTQLVEEVEAEVVERLRKMKITAEHTAKVTKGDGKLLSFSWEPPRSGAETPLSKVKLELHICQIIGTAGPQFQLQTTLRCIRDSKDISVSQDLPPVLDVEESLPVTNVVTATFEILPVLGSMLIRAT